MPSKLIDTIGCFYKHNINFNIYFFSYNPLSGVVKDSFQVKSGLHSPKFCVQSSRCLQQWGLTFRFWEARKNNSSGLYCSGVSWIPLTRAPEEMPGSGAFLR